jgi:hypothetical protein
MTPTEPIPLCAPFESVEKVILGRLTLVDSHIEGTDEDCQLVTLCVTDERFEVP